VALVVSRTNQHRGLLQSLTGPDMVTFMVAPASVWTGWAPMTALLLSYASHLVGDSATKSGIQLLYPNPSRFYLLPRGWRITTGSLAEDALLAPLALLVLWLLMGHFVS
jgi:membrane-bound metal-dependent hydrolase YbcI (DUF457 family)